MSNGQVAATTSFQQGAYGIGIYACNFFGSTSFNMPVNFYNNFGLAGY